MPGVARVRPSKRVHPTAVVDGVVDLLDGAEVGAFAYLTGHVVIGERTRISPHVVIGTDGEHRSARSVGAIRIGHDSTVREFCCIQRGTGERETSIGDRVMLMDRVHVAHDVVIDDDVTVSPGVVFGGHTHVHKGATIGIGASTHQHVTIGAYAMIGMGAVVIRDVPPFAVVVGNPARVLGRNEHAVRALLSIDANLTDVEAWALLNYNADSGRGRRGTR